MTAKLPLKVINLWAGPGAGKSTTAAGLFNLMKIKGENVELVTEYAKDVTWEKNFGNLENQLLVLAEQDKRLRRLVGQVEWAITDSPLPLGEAYMTPEYEPWLPQAIMGAFSRYHNLNFLVERVKPYVRVGRNQTEHQALAVDMQVSSLFWEYADEDDKWPDERPLRWVGVPGDSEAPYRIYEHIKEIYNAA